MLGAYTACGEHGGGHTIWHFRTCDAITYGPPLASHGNTAIRPAAVRISPTPTPPTRAGTARPSRSLATGSAPLGAVMTPGPR